MKQAAIFVVALGVLGGMSPEAGAVVTKCHKAACPQVSQPAKNVTATVETNDVSSTATPKMRLKPKTR